MRATTFIEILKKVTISDLSSRIVTMVGEDDIRDLTGDTGIIFYQSVLGIVAGNYILIYINNEDEANIYRMMQSVSRGMESTDMIADAIYSDPEGQIIALVKIDD